MFANGLVDEVRSLRDGPKPLGPIPAQGVGYLEVLEHLEGRFSLEETITRVQARTRQFAKRQATWFRGLVEVRSWPVGSDETSESIAERIASVVVGCQLSVVSEESRPNAYNRQPTTDN
jgi:tRNA dimethylallyltransferase